MVKHQHDRRKCGKSTARVLLVLSVLVFAGARPWDLYDPTLDHYTRAIRQVSSGKILRGIETARAAARHAPDSRDAWVNLSGFYLKLFNMEDYAEPVSHVQALELFAIANYGMRKWPDFHGSIHNMESTLRWLSSSAPEEAGLTYDVTLDGTETWRLPPDQSTGDRRVAYEYGIENAPSPEKVVLHRGPLFIRRPYQKFRRNTERELARIAKLQKMAKERKSRQDLLPYCILVCIYICLSLPPLSDPVELRHCIQYATQGLEYPAPCSHPSPAPPQTQSCTSIPAPCKRYSLDNIIERCAARRAVDLVQRRIEKPNCRLTGCDALRVDQANEPSDGRRGR